MITLGEKQINAVIKMEDFLKIGSHRLSFNNYSEFNDYFELLQKKCNKKRKLLGAVDSGKITFSEINEKSRNKKVNYYNQEDVLRQYAIKYIEKYFPTIKKLEIKLFEKCQNEVLVQEVIEKVKNLINEENMINNKVYIETMFGSQNINKIKTKLYNKRFPKELIEKKIEELENTPNSLISDEVMRNKIIKMIKKGKSKQEIVFRLKERPQDEDIILKILDEEYSEETNQSVLINEYNKLSGKYDDNKIIQKLISKGFKYKDIKKVINGE